MKLKPLALTALASLALLSAAACSKGGDQSSNTTTTTTATESSPAAAAASSPPTATAAGNTSQAAHTENQEGGAVSAGGGDAAHGKQLFMSQPCTSCHGANGTEGGVGPSLKNEKSRKNFAQVVAQIKNPAPPMPKLYPSPLTDKDVNDLAAFVETL